MPEEPIKLTQIKPGSSTLQPTSVRANKARKTNDKYSQICSSGTVAPKAIIDHPEHDRSEENKKELANEWSAFDDRTRRFPEASQQWSEFGFVCVYYL